MDTAAEVPDVEVRPRVRVAGARGEDTLASLELTDLDTGAASTVDADAVFILIGAQPRTDWLGDVVVRDRWGHIRTGFDVETGTDGTPRQPMLLETNLPGVFAAGDVRRGSVKRVASAVGEGAVAVQLPHGYPDRSTAATPAR